MAEELHRSSFNQDSVSRWPPVVEGRRQDHHADVTSYNTNRRLVSCSKRHPSPPRTEYIRRQAQPRTGTKPPTSAPGPTTHSAPLAPTAAPHARSRCGPRPQRRTRVSAGPLPGRVPQTPGPGAYPGFRPVGFQGGTGGREKAFRRLHTALFPPRPLSTGGYTSKGPVRVGDVGREDALGRNRSRCQ